jgi:2',3'-cyclic-nucleotide 2'-phosphodiesterase (5'-nucleotidase family)
MKILQVLIISVVFLLSCSPARQVQSSDDGIIEFTILQLNDVYEIAPLSGGTIGGMARVATVRKQLLAENSNVLTILSGDFLSPSLLGTLKQDGERIRGKQMVELMNAVGMDLVIFGNHEFDISKEDLQKRINESEFDWISTNYQELHGDEAQPFYKERNGQKEFFPESYIWSIDDRDGTSLDVGFFSATLPTKCDYCYYTDYESAALEMAQELTGKSDIVLAITHLELAEDLAFAGKVQHVPLIMGGHDHDNMIHQKGNVVITKADANAKTVYVHRFRYNKNTRETDLKSSLKTLDMTVPLDPESTKLVRKWNDIIDKNIMSIVPNPYEVIYKANIPLDGRETTVRNQQSNMGKLFAEAMLWSSGTLAQCGIMNGGSVRIDDQLHGDVVALDIFRALPFGGEVLIVEMKGKLLQSVLDEGEKSAGTGAFLQRANIASRNGDWYIGNDQIKPDANYSVAMNDYLLRGYDIPILNSENTDVLNVIRPGVEDPDSLRTDLRKAIVAYCNNLKK